MLFLAEDGWPTQTRGKLMRDISRDSQGLQPVAMPDGGFGGALSALDHQLTIGEKCRAQLLLQALQAQEGLQLEELLRLEVRQFRLCLSLDQEIGIDLLDQVFALLERAEQLGEDLHLAEALCCLGRFQSRAQVITLALQSVARAEALYTRLGDEHGLHICLMLVCKFLHDEAMHEEAILRQRTRRGRRAFVAGLRPLLHDSEGENFCSERPSG